MGYTLYGRKGAGSLAAQFVLEETGQPYETVWVDDAMAADPGYRRINPTGKIPALGLPDGSSIFESAAIVIHLAETNPATGLAPPPGTPEHARFLQWMLFLATGLYGAALRYYYAPRYTTGGDGEGVKAAAAADFDRHLEIAEAHLAPHLLGETLSAADLYLFMLASWHPEGEAAVRTRFPRLGALAAALAARPAIARVLAANRE
jgi:glutathione S-transferase